MDRPATRPTAKVPTRGSSHDDDDDLDLPPLDGAPLDSEEENEIAGEIDDPASPSSAADAFDDATADGPIDFAVDGDEGGWLDDTDCSQTLDVGAFDLALGPEESLIDDDESDADKAAGNDDVACASEPSLVTDGGEEGPLAEDDELREEDLPALDADDGDEISNDILFDRVIVADNEELRWDDRAWARMPFAETLCNGAAYESDSLAASCEPGDEKNPRDATWRRLEETGGVTAAAIVPGGSAVVAIEQLSRVLLVRILPDGIARIIAEMDDDESIRVTALHWDAARGCLIAIGPFGTQGFQPV
ncbi:MAG: hypothetical protein FWD73_02415 [Polyangiaceae bacterium]|nr:hypothetical protein [Polyangiaceae bacterium]